MNTVDSRFLAVAAKQPSINAGWQIRVLDYKDMTSTVAIMPEFVSFRFTQQLNDPGLGSVTIDTDSPWWSQKLMNGLSNNAIRDREYVFEMWENGSKRFAFLGTTVANNLAGEDETLMTTISGPGIGHVLNWACIMRPGWPKKAPILRYQKMMIGNKLKKIPIYRDVSGSNALPAFLWQFPVGYTSMRMWYTVFRAAQARGVIPWVKPMFNALTDSNKKPWLYVKTLQAIVDQHGYQPENPGETLLDFLNECTGQDYSSWFGQRLEWMMYPGFRLDVRPTIGTDRSKTIVFYTGQLISNERARDREKIFNRIVAVDVEGNESTVVSKGSVDTWNLRERRDETNKNITTKTLRDELARRYLEQSKAQKSEYTIQVPSTEQGRIPYRHYFVGDYISVSDSGRDYTNIILGKYRVMAITLSLESDQTEPDCELTLQSIIDSKMIEIEKRIAKLVNEPRNFNLGDLKDIKIPKRPTTDVGLVYNSEQRSWQSAPAAATVYTGTTDPATVPGNRVRPGDFWYSG